MVFSDDIAIERVESPHQWHSLEKTAATRGDYQYVQFNANSDDATSRSCETGGGSCGPHVIATGQTLTGFEVWTKERISYTSYSIGDDQLNLSYLESR